jgi:hypothetical protein
MYVCQSCIEKYRLKENLNSGVSHHTFCETCGYLDDYWENHKWCVWTNDLDRPICKPDPRQFVGSQLMGLFCQRLFQLLFDNDGQVVLQIPAEESEAFIVPGVYVGRGTHPAPQECGATHPVFKSRVKCERWNPGGVQCVFDHVGVVTYTNGRREVLTWQVSSKNGSESSDISKISTKTKTGKSKDRS